MGYTWAQRLALVLLSIGGIIVIMSALVDVRERHSSPETVVRAYFAALELGDVPTALAAIAPEARSDAAAFVENSVLNTYDVTGIAVRQPSLLDQLRGESGLPTDATVFLTITEYTDGTQWQAGPDVALVDEQGQWYLAKPPLS